MRPSPTLALLSGAALTAAAVLWVPEFRVVDGDTVRHGFWKWRLVGFDAPSPHTSGWQHAACAEELALGRRAKQRLAQLVASGRAQINPAPGRHPHGDRLGRLTVDGRDVGTLLIAEGLARPYDGRAKRSWCE